MVNNGFLINDRELFFIKKIIPFKINVLKKEKVTLNIVIKYFYGY